MGAVQVLRQYKGTLTVSLPIEGGFFPTVKSILQLFDQVGLSGQPEQPLLPEAPLPDEIGTLFHQHGGQLAPEPALVAHGFLQLLAEDPLKNKTTLINGNA